MPENRIHWKEPKRRGGPTLTMQEVKKRLGYKDMHAVVKLVVELGPYRGGLPGYINYGSEWVLHTEPDPGRRVMFYEEDVDAWMAAHPRNRAHPTRKDEEKRVQESSYPKEYDEQMKQEVLDLAAQRKDNQGRVNRKKLLQELHDMYGPGRWHRWHYSILKHILDENGYPPLQKQPDQVRQIKIS